MPAARPFALFALLLAACAGDSKGTDATTFATFTGGQSDAEDSADPTAGPATGDPGTGGPGTDGVTVTSSPEVTSGGASSSSDPDTTAPDPSTSPDGTSSDPDPDTTAAASSSSDSDSASSTTDATTAADLGCEAYCDEITANCSDANAQYSSVESCLASCAAFEPGTLADTAGNTVGCRTYHAGAAGVDPDLHCTHAGPGGAGVCGDNCDGFCAIALAACPDVYADHLECLDDCALFPDAEKYDTSDASGDSLACRLYHLTVASVEPEIHCAHIASDSPVCQ